MRNFFKKNQPRAAIYHGPQILKTAQVVQEKKLTTYLTVKPEVKVTGGQFVEVALKNTVTNGTLITVPAWATHPKLMCEFLQLLGLSFP